MNTQSSKFLGSLFILFLLLLAGFASADNYTEVPTPEPIDPFDWNDLLEEEYEEPVDWEEIDISESLDWDEPVPSPETEPAPETDTAPVENLEYEISLANGAVYGVGLNEEEGLLEFESISSIESVEEDFFGSWADFDIDFELSTANGAIFGEGLASEEGPPVIEALSTIEPVLIVEKSENEIEQDNFEFSTANGAIFGESLSILEEEFQSGISPFMLQVEEPVSEIEKKGAQVTTPSGSQEITDEGPTLATPNYDGATGTKPGAQVLLPDKDKKPT